MQVLQIVMIVAGAVFIYMALFLRRDAEGKIENVLFRLWYAVDTAEESWTARVTQFVRRIVLVVAYAFRIFYGRQIISRRSLKVATFFSFGSLSAFVLMVVVLTSFFGPNQSTVLRIIGGIVSIGLLVAWLLGCASRLKSYLKDLRYAEEADIFDAVMLAGLPGFLGLGTHLAGMIAGVAAGAETRHIWEILGGLWFLLALPFALVSDFVAIFASRYLLERARRGRSIFRHLEATMGCALLSCILIAVPVTAPWLLFPLLGKSESTYPIYYAINSTGSAIGIFNISTCVPFLLLLLFTIALTLNRLIWPIFSTPLSRLAEATTEKRRKVFFTLGMLLLSPVILEFEWLADLVKSWML